MTEDELHSAKTRQMYNEMRQCLLNIGKIYAAGKPKVNIQSEFVQNEIPDSLNEPLTYVTDMTEITTLTDNHARKPCKDVTTQTEPQTEINTVSDI